MYFREYASIDNRYCKAQAVPADAEWVVTEKVHGTNTGIYVDAGGAVKVARRTGFAEIPSKHYRADVVVEELSDALRSAARAVIAKYGCRAPTDFAIFYGELYGAIYPETECKAGLMPVQRGVYYSNQVHFSCFDIVVVRPSERREVSEGQLLATLWHASRKVLVLFDKSRESADARRSLEEHFAKIAEEVSGGSASLAPTRDYIRKVLDGHASNVMRDMPGCPRVELSPQETLLSQTERCQTCAQHRVPFAEILFRGAREAAVAFSKAVRAAPTTIAEKHGMLGPYSEREGNVVRTDMPIRVGERAALVVTKDKNPKFSEVARSKHEKSSEDLKMEAPRFVTQNRLDNVISKVALDTAPEALAQFLAKDALSEMQKRGQFVQVFAEQSDLASEELKRVLVAHSASLVERYMGKAS